MFGLGYILVHLGLMGILIELVFRFLHSCYLCRRTWQVLLGTYMTILDGDVSMEKVMELKVNEFTERWSNADKTLNIVSYP